MENRLKYILQFGEIDLGKISEVGGKNASLGELVNGLKSAGVNVPDGFALSAEAYRIFIATNKMEEKISGLLNKLNTEKLADLEKAGKHIRDHLRAAKLPQEVRNEIEKAYLRLQNKYGTEIKLAVRSSATAEDLPSASFAGQQETYLNISGTEDLLEAIHNCYISLFTDRAIKYREDHGFDHLKVALSVGIQLMVRSDSASSGVIFTIDPDSGFRNVILVSSIWGLGENIVQGTVNPDEFYVFKPTLHTSHSAIISHKLGSKLKTMIFREDGSGTTNIATPLSKQIKFSLSDEEIIQLALWSEKIEAHYKKPMDIEWAKDGVTGTLFIVQARPETVFSTKRKTKFYQKYELKETGKILCSGTGLGNRIAAGTARLLSTPDDMERLNHGEILVTQKTNPDWDPILKKAAAIVTDQGGRTSHAAIVARELGAVAVVGTNDATRKIRDGELVTVSTVGGEKGAVYAGKSKWTVTDIDISKIKLPETKVMFILGDPDQAFALTAIPNNGVGLMRLEFIINNAIQIHPMALRKYSTLKNKSALQTIDRLTHNYPDKEEYFIAKLSESVAMIAAAFYPKDVIVRMSDFKSNEYANLIGGEEFEPKESNPMLGFRGASRYYHPLYREGFEMECQAIRRVRDEMGFTNIKVMIPFCRTIDEAKKVLDIMADEGLARGHNNLEIYMMCEIPSNVVLADHFSDYFDGFSIGSNDLTQLTLGVDRDSQLLAGLFSAQDPAVMQMIRQVIKSAHRTKTKIGLCGQEPSDDPNFARFLVQEGIDSISFNPDAILEGIENIEKAEKSRIEEITHS
ncbi:MAG: phosphoenolpyruvate synthase [Saprospiraceae bacterium]|nr:phosphoenolpyruvate synthase [Saprospiraceae bacterium]